MRIFSTTKRKIGAAVFVVFAGYVLWMCLQPNTARDDIYLMTQWTEGYDSNARAEYVKKIIARGPEAIDPVIEAIG